MPNKRTPTKASRAKVPVTLDEVDRIRREAHDIVHKSMPHVTQVLLGSRKWSNQQVRLFGMMLNKVLPDLSEAAISIKTTPDDLENMTIEELEMLAARLEAEDGSVDEDDSYPRTIDIDDNGNPIEERTDVENEHPEGSEALLPQEHD